MKLENAMNLLSDALADARGAFAEIGIGAEQNLKEEITDGSGYIYGALVVGYGTVKEDECLFFPLDIAVNASEVDENELNECKNDFKAKTGALVTLLSNSENKAEAITKFGEEIQKTREMELLGQVKELEKDTGRNLKIALSAGAVMLLLAAICIIISRLI